MATDLQFNVTALDKATATFLKLAAQVDKLSQKIDKLDGKKAEVKADADTAKAEAKLDAVSDKVKRIDGSKATVKVGVDKSLGDSLVQLNAVGRALKSIALPAAAIAAAPQLAAIGSAAASMSGALLLMPAAGLAASAAIGTLTVAFNDFGTALYQGASKTKIKEANEALAAMGPNARATAMAIRDMKAPFEDLRKVVQEKFFAGLGAEVRDLGRIYFPVLRTGMAGIATELNTSARGFAAWAQSSETVRATSVIFEQTRNTMRALAPAVTNVSDGILKIGVTGARYLPFLAAEASKLTARFRGWVAQAQASGKLDQWIQTGITKVQQLGSIVGNVGGILSSVFSAASASGADFLGTVDRITEKVNAFFRSAQGQNTLTSVFTEIRATVDALEPGVRAVGEAIAYIVTRAAESGVIHEAAAALSAMLVAAGPLAGQLTNLAFTILPPVIQLIGALAPVLGPAVAGFYALATATKGLSAVQGVITGFGAKLAAASVNAAGFTEKITGSAGAGDRLATVGGRLSGVLGGVSTALPLVAVAAGGVAIAYEVLRDKSDELAVSVINGQKSMSQAVEEHNQHLESQRDSLKTVSDQGYVSASMMNDLKVGTSQEAEAVRDSASAHDQLLQKMRDHAASLPPLQAAQENVKIAQQEYNYQVEQFGPASEQAQVAASDLALARDREKQAALDAAAAEKTLGDQIVETSQQAAAAANADVAYQQGLLSLEQAQNRAAEAAKNHSAGSLQVREANLQVVQANLQVAEAARRKAEADAVATGATNAAEIGAQAYKDELVRLAGQASGPTKEALLTAAGATNTAEAAASTAEIRSRLHKDELGRLAGQANGPLAAALQNARGNFDTLGGAHATAEQRAAAQKAELQRLANMASGPIRTELQRMADQIRTLPDKTVNITAAGKYSIDPIGGVSGPGTYTGGILGVQGGRVTSVRRYDRGGVMPGYTPGRDVHTFVSPTGGGLHLSGGEAVMRPEWTKAVSPGWVHAANKAARSGGIGGVQQFLQVNPPGRTEADQGFASGGIIGHHGFPGYAGGGLFMTGTPFSRIPVEVYNSMIPTMISTMAPRLAAEMKRRQAAAQAAMGGGTVAGNVGAMMAALRGRFPGLALISGYRPGAITATGSRSYHSMGRAVDVPPRMDVFNWIKGTYGARTKELIFSPAGGGQIHNGRPHMYTGITRAMHWDHVHWAMRNGGIVPRVYDQGGVLPPGATLAINNTGRPETVIPAARRGGGSGDLIAELRRVVAEVHALRGDVDHHGDVAATNARLDVTNRLLAAAGGNAATSAGANRFVGEMGPF